MGFNQNVAEEALVKCGRHCCLCHKFCGIKIELHHIKQKSDDGEDSIDNCLPLCFDCHAEVKMYNPDHPKGKKYSESELLRHRDRWYEKVANSATMLMVESYNRLDKEVTKRIINILDFTMKNIIKKFDFGACFDYDMLGPLYDFVISSDYPELEFLDPDLENGKRELLLKANLFLDSVSQNTFKDKGLNIRLWRIPYDWEENKKMKAREAMNNSSDELWKQYCNFIRSCRIRLNV
jgi:hypothetical protein